MFVAEVSAVEWINFLLVLLKTFLFLSLMLLLTSYLKGIGKNLNIWNGKSWSRAPSSKPTAKEFWRV